MTEDGICCGCDTIGNPYMYWSSNMRETFYSFPNGSDFYENLVTNRHTFVGNPLLQGRYYDLRTGHVDNAPERSKWRLNLVKTRASATGAIGSKNKDKFSSHKDWKVKLFPSRQVDFVFGVHPNRSNGNISGRPAGSASHPGSLEVAWFNFGYINNYYLNNFLINQDIALMRSIVCYHDNAQSQVVCTGTSPRINAFRRSDPEEFEMPYDSNIGTDEVAVCTIDVATQQTVYENLFGQFAYDTDTINSGGAPIKRALVFFTNMENITRANYCANPWFLVVSTYDDWKEPYRGWLIARSPIDPSMSYAGGDSNQVPAGKPAVVRAAFHSYTYGETPNKFPWVIAVDKTNRRWVTGKWTQSMTVPGFDDEGEPITASVPQLADADIVNTLHTGVLSVNAILLCYNRVRERELAIWIDKSPRASDWNNVPGGRPSYYNIFEDRTILAIGYSIEQVLMYDSERTPAFFEWSKKYVFYWPPGDGITAYDGCKNPSALGKPNAGQEDNIFYSEEDDILAYTAEDYLTKPGPPPRHLYKFGLERSFLQYYTYILPTFITCDDDGMVYVGSPNFVAKVGRYASALTTLNLDPQLNTEERWSHVFSDHYPRKKTQTTNPCNGETTFRTVPRQKEYDLILDSGINYGILNSREFCIVPTSYGIVIKGAEGSPEMATTRDFAKTKFYEPEITRNAYSRSQWITDWVFSKDGKQRKPCIEEAFLSPQINATVKENLFAPYEAPTGVIPHPNIPGIDSVGTFKFLDRIIAEEGARFPLLPKSQQREEKYLVSRRYGDELLFDFFVSGPAQFLLPVFGGGSGSFDDMTLRVNSYWTIPIGNYYQDENVGNGNAYNEFAIRLSNLNNLNKNDIFSLPNALAKLSNETIGADHGWAHTTYMRFFVAGTEVVADRYYNPNSLAPAETVLTTEGENHWWINGNSARPFTGDFFERQYRGILLDVCDTPEIP